MCHRPRVFRQPPRQDGSVRVFRQLRAQVVQEEAAAAPPLKGGSAGHLRGAHRRQSLLPPVQLRGAGRPVAPESPVAGGSVVPAARPAGPEWDLFQHVDPGQQVRPRLGPNSVCCGAAGVHSPVPRAGRPPRVPGFVLVLGPGPWRRRAAPPPRVAVSGPPHQVAAVRGAVGRCPRCRAAGRPSGHRAGLRVHRPVGQWAGVAGHVLQHGRGPGARPAGRTGGCGCFAVCVCVYVCVCFVWGS